MPNFEKKIYEVLSVNRAEELGYDVWEQFVVPPFYDKLDLTSARKPRIIEGGRGCGKTMLLRYLSHQSMFSKKRNIIPKDALSHIGLYWKADTQFCNAMIKRNIPEDKWISSFNHFSALIISMEILNSLKSISNSKLENINRDEFNKIDYSRLKAFDVNLSSDSENLFKTLENYFWQFESWVNDLKKNEPTFLPGLTFIHALIKLIKNQITIMADAIYYVYLDEYENLTDYQQKIINTWVKHSEVPLIINLAMKKNAFLNRKTLGSESLTDINDYRIHDLEEYLNENDNFQVLSAEILALKLSSYNVIEFPIDPKKIIDPSFIKERKNKPYRENIIHSAQKLFPDYSQAELANFVFNDKNLITNLENKIKSALEFRGSNLSLKLFINKNHPEASIVIPALLYRKSITPEEIVSEFELLIQGKDNRFTGTTSWIHNNFIGCLLQLYAPYSRPCQFFSGFKTFCLLSHGNLRHFLELCYKSLYKAIDDNDKLIIPISPIKQAEAARQASTQFIGEIRSLGPKGNQLHTFVLRLGTIFNLAHRRPSQSEPEQNHFSLNKGDGGLNSEDAEFFNEAIKWSVLYESFETKSKDEYHRQSIEYILNPIYSPYFFISYRKKRKLDLSYQDWNTIIRGTGDDFIALKKRYSKKWDIDQLDTEPMLFSFFE